MEYNSIDDSGNIILRGRIVYFLRFGQVSMKRKKQS